MMTITSNVKSRYTEGGGQNDMFSVKYFYKDPLANKRSL